MRNEDYDRELLAGVTAICAVLTLIIAPFETAKPGVAKTVAQATTRIEHLEPVRVVGAPLVLNTNPSVRLAKD